MDDVTRGARAIVLCPDIRGQAYVIDAAERLEEACGLALAIGVVVEDARIIPVRTVRPNTLFGSGQVEQIATDCELHEVELVIVDGALSPIQQRNLEEKLKRKVIDRTGLILEIFGERAATAEGRLQVELAHLDYQQSRLVRSWTHLERQRGGFGFLGGPGETQIEADRRMIRQRMARLRKELEQVRKTRTLHRARRGRAPWPVIALVGYTNAGKSTLFNRLTGADVMAEDLLFATLDPTMRAIELPGIEKAILSDTVGFISDLPTQLVAAFRATLEEVTGADIIVHVRDMSNPAHEAQKKQVLSVLADLGVVDAEGQVSGIPIVEAWNKLDLVAIERANELHEMAKSQGDAIVLSALTGEGVDMLLQLIGEMLKVEAAVVEIELPASDGRRIAWLHAHGEVLGDVEAGEGEKGPLRRLTVRLNPKQRGQFEQL
ncbi:MAG: GTPase HflX [Altererythrobacter sp.]|uniref:GTPase HflX n=1 Tax=Altererythrobacter sp. TaxID=1872480 RepID=UPI001B1FF18D|nr:GTPase HflX [Altererythrobacter sp.]MBO6641423.1 GTPase HflX [Altererythrobacter sp.]MBO6707878.1 GTPase HflX [Altererythrobacter sp.]